MVSKDIHILDGFIPKFRIKLNENKIIKPGYRQIPPNECIPLNRPHTSLSWLVNCVRKGERELKLDVSIDRYLLESSFNRINSRPTNRDGGARSISVNNVDDYPQEVERGQCLGFGVFLLQYFPLVNV